MRDAGSVPPQPPAPTHPASRIPSPDLPPPGISYDPPGGDLFSSDPVPQAGSLEAIAQLVASCTKCRLCEGRRHTVPGEGARSEEHTSELQSRLHLVCRLLLEKKKNTA